ncbi:MAG TPA: hypothetical protein VK147_11945 [Candidatus Didemnitutus sp.]|nr:hypothetical protein [Candidatus Didemnitutus sp.]
MCASVLLASCAKEERIDQGNVVNQYKLPIVKQSDAVPRANAAILELTTLGVDHPYHDVAIQWPINDRGFEMSVSVRELTGQNLYVENLYPTPDGRGSVLSVVNADDNVAAVRPEHTRLVLTIHEPIDYTLQRVDDRFYAQAMTYFKRWDPDTVDHEPFDDMLSSFVDSLPNEKSVEAIGKLYTIDVNGDSSLDVIHYGYYQSEDPVLRAWIRDRGRLRLTIQKEGILTNINGLSSKGLTSFTFLTLEPNGQQISAVENIIPGTKNDPKSRSSVTTIVSWGCKEPAVWLQFPLLAWIISDTARLGFSPGKLSSGTESTDLNWAEWSQVEDGQTCHVLAREIDVKGNEWLFVVVQVSIRGDYQKYVAAEQKWSGLVGVGGWLPASDVDVTDKIPVLPMR